MKFSKIALGVVLGVSFAFANSIDFNELEESIDTYVLANKGQSVGVCDDPNNPECVELVEESCSKKRNMTKEECAEGLYHFNSTPFVTSMAAKHMFSELDTIISADNTEDFDKFLKILEKKSALDELSKGLGGELLTSMAYHNSIGCLKVFKGYISDIKSHKIDGESIFDYMKYTRANKEFLRVLGE